MPGVYHLSVDQVVEEAEVVAADGIPGMLLFGLPSAKDEVGSEAYADDGIVNSCHVLSPCLPHSGDESWLASALRPGGSWHTT